MRRLLVLVVVTLAAVLAPSAFASVETEIVAVDVARPDAVVEKPPAANRFTLAGLHWKGSGRVLFRTRSLAGHWSAWRPAAPEDEDGPDPSSRELRAHGGWRIGNPWWVGPSDRIETRTVGSVSRVRAYTVWSPELRVPYRRLAAAEQPLIVPRASWGANEAIRRAPPAYAPDVRFAVVHHTAGRNDYTRAEAPAIVRGIQLYHVQANGWNDIGYNFLVDRFGTVYEGRHGGVDRNVVGAHARGFNTRSVGVALLGTYGGTTPSQAAQDALARLLAWRLDVAHVDPTGFLTVLSGGNERYANGIPVPLRVVSGHRDTGFTECPGNRLYARLNALAATARQTGLPKIFDPNVEANDAGFRFTARLAGAAPWSVVVRSPAGTEVARGTGTGMSVDWTWDSSGAPAGMFEWTISAGSARPASGSVRTTGDAVLAIEELSADVAAISPNDDGQADSAIVTYRLTLPANVSVEIQDEAGVVVATVVDRMWSRAGTHRVTIGAPDLPDGRYEVVVTARRVDGAEAVGRLPLAVTRTLGAVSVSPAALSPNGDGRNDRLVIRFALASRADVRVRVLRDGRGVAGILSRQLAAGPQRVLWSGIRAAGPVRDGAYTVVVDVRDSIGRLSFPSPLVVDTRAPLVQVLPGRRLRIRVSEPAVLRLRINGAPLRREVKQAGVVRVAWPDAIRRVRVAAVDAAGNTSASVLVTASNLVSTGQ